MTDNDDLATLLHGYTSREYAQSCEHRHASRELWPAIVVTALDPRRPIRGWRCVEERDDGARWESDGGGLTVIESAALEDDGTFWQHVSVSKLGLIAVAMPSWRDMERVKDAFIGPDRYAYSVFPPSTRWVSIGNVAHLWARVEDGAGEVLPEFSAMLNGVRTV